MKKKKIITLLTGLLIALMLFVACEMEVEEVVQDFALTDPYISVQPASAAYFVGEEPDLPLSIEIYDWAAKEGNLTYQWYTFAAIDDYVKGDVTEIPGATDKTYMPSGAYALKTAAGNKNYYYVEVTNTNPAVSIGDQTGSTRSDVAIISFTATGGALPPIISRNPGSAGYQAGRAVSPLAPRASSRPDRTIPGIGATARTVLLTYQWWSLTVTGTGGNKTITREQITNATDSAYQPDPLDLKAGNNYFYVVVTSTERSGTTAVPVENDASETSIPAVIDIQRGARAAAPTITVQPRDRMYLDSEAAVALTVAGVSRDNGEISYQWYKNNGAVLNTATATLLTAADAKTASYTPALPASGAAAEYYYAVVTNFTEYVIETEEGDNTTATATSKLAKVSVAVSGTPTYNATVTVADPKDPVNRYQYVRGYGGMDVAWANFPETYPAEMHTMYNPDTGLGYNINRIMISPGNVDPAAEVERLVNAHRRYYRENVKIVNSYGGYNLASPWSPPKEWKSNNSINGGGRLMYQYRKQFANYLRTFAQDMYNQGAPIYAISISNEPNYTAGYDGCEWEPEEMRDFYKAVGRFTNGVRGYGGGKQIPAVLTVNGESANTPRINVAALIDPVSRAAIDLLCRHVYGNQDVSLWRFSPTGQANIAEPTNSTTNNILSRGNGTKMEVWMTEHNINSASAQGYVVDSTWNYLWRYMNDVDLVMRLNNENAFVWWASKRFYSMIGDGQYGTGAQNNTSSPAVLPRGWGLSHYAKYTNDTHRIAAVVSGNLADNTTPIVYEQTGTNNTVNVNLRTFSLDNTSARITAYASIASGKDNAPINDGVDDVEFISLVMWTPTSTDGSGGHNMGTIKIEMPEINGTQFEIGSYTAIKTTSAATAHAAETVIVAPDRKSAYVTLDRSQMLSVKFIKR